MSPKLGIIQLMFLLISLSLIDDVEREKAKGTRLLAKANPLVIAWGAFEVVNNIVGFVTGMDSLINMFKPKEHSDEKFQTNVVTKLDELRQFLDRSFKAVDHGFADVKNAIQSTFAQGILENALEEDKNYVLNIDIKLNSIRSRYDKDYSNIRQGIKNYHDDSVKNYISSIVEEDTLKDLLEQVLFATKLQGERGQLFHKNVFEIAVRYLKNEKYHLRECNELPTYDRVFLFYSYILTTVVKGYTMIVMSYQYLKMTSTDKAFYKARQIEYQNYFKRDIIEITNAAKHYLDTIDTINDKSSYACEPQTWEEGKNYFQLKNYASMELRIHPCSYHGDGTRGTFTLLCNDVFNDRTYSGLPRNSFNEYINRTGLRTIQKCNQLFENNLYALCSVGSNSNPYLSIRKIRLTPTYCDYGHNEVVTSARFKEKEGMVFIEVQCGIFVDGQIDKNSLRWNTTQRDSYSLKNPPSDYLVIQWDLKSFPLVDYMAPENEFIVGLGFKKINDFISLEIVSKNIYNSSGLHSTVMPDNYSVLRTELHLETLPLVLNQRNKINEISEPNKFFVRMTPWRLYERTKWSAFFRTPVVPFFDMSEYKPPMAFPLGGIGLIHKSVPGHAGFLALRFFIPNKMHYIPKNYAVKLVMKPVNYLLLMMYK